MTYQDLETTLNKMPFMPKGEPSLNNIKAAIESLNLKSDAEKTILIAGTNGKGSTGKALQHILTQQGFQVGFYSSPHLETYCERININLKDISENIFTEVFHFLLPVFKKFNLSHFESLTLMAYYFFNSQNLDFHIYEVGMGGVWDATNAVPHKHCVITNIGKDHIEFLGDSEEERLCNKLGIVCENSCVYLGSFFQQRSKLLLQARNYIQQKQATEVDLIKDLEIEIRPDIIPNYLIKRGNTTYPMLLKGKHSFENIELSLRVAKKLGIDLNFALDCIAKVRWPGRFEIFNYKSKTVILSGDHNPDGIQSLIQILKDSTATSFSCILGLSQGRDINECIVPILNDPRCKKLYITQASYKAQSIDVLKSHTELSTCQFYSSREQALEQSLNDTTEFILVTGSLYLVGDLRKKMGTEAVPIL